MRTLPGFTNGRDGEQRGGGFSHRVFSPAFFYAEMLPQFHVQVAYLRMV